MKFNHYLNLRRITHAAGILQTCFYNKALKVMEDDSDIDDSEETDNNEETNED